MPQELQPPYGEGLKLGSPKADSGSCVRLINSGAQPLVFGSWLPEDFEKFASYASGTSVPTFADTPAVDTSALNNDPTLSCNAHWGMEGTEGMEGTSGAYAHATAQQLPAGCAPFLSALHFLMSANCAPLMQHQFVPTPAQPMFLAPASLPLFAPQLIHLLGSIPGIVAPNPIPSAWGSSCSASTSLTTTYHDLAYADSTGFWLHGMYFPSYEHFIAYRRGAIAYNFHFYGIRPHFRPPPGLPRPRPPTKSGAAIPCTAASTPVMVSVVSVSPDAGSDVFFPTSRAADANEGGSDSPCGSPASSSTCSNGDSDDAVSDLNHADPEADLFCEAQHLADGLGCLHPKGVSASSVEAAAPQLSAALEPDSGRESQAQPAYGRCLAGIETCTPVAAAGSAVTAVAGYTCECASDGEQRLAAVCGSCASAPVLLPRVLSPVRCCQMGSGGGRAGGDPWDEVREDIRYVNSFGIAGGSPTAGVCSQWLERQLRVLVERVVGDALLLGYEDAA